MVGKKADKEGNHATDALAHAASMRVGFTEQADESQIEGYLSRAVALRNLTMDYLPKLEHAKYVTRMRALLYARERGARNDSEMLCFSGHDLC